jgi:steroid 5-alpha reductase family enzyme
MTSLEYEAPKAGTKGTVNHASFPEAMFGGFLGIGVIFGAWGQASYVDYSKCYDISNLKKCFTFSPVEGINAFEHLVFYVTVLMLAVFIGSLILGHIVKKRGTADPSIVDRLWSIVPAVYCGFLYYRSTIAAKNSMDVGTSNRLLLITVLTTMWAIRLTWNFARKGGYSGGEDYRWVEVESWMTKLQFEFFNLVFVVGAQMTVLVGICTPAAAAYIAAADGEPHPINSVDIAAAACFLAHLYMEYVSDCQMFDFQSNKYANKAKGIKPLKESEEDDGFIQTGMWSISRHPNYYSEVTIWWSIYLFSVAATGDILNYSMIGAIWLSVLFVPPRASLDMTESISSRKYSKYSRYQKTVSRFIPWYSSA